MRIIDDTYFVGELYLPNVTAIEGTTSAKTELQTLIGAKEVDYLEWFFGYELAKAIIAALDAGGSLPTRIDSIINGKEFTDSWGKLQKWKGLKRATDKWSPIAGFVYYYWRKKEATQSTKAGETISEVENSTTMSAGEKAAYNWNKAVDDNYILFDFMKMNAADYPEYSIYSYDQFKRRELLSKINVFDL